MASLDSLVVIGASHGGLSVLKTILSALPKDFPAPVLVAMHVGAYNSRLPALLQAVSPMPVKHACEGDALEPGVVLVAPPDQHMLINGHQIRLVRGAKENYSRPAVDPLFRSAAIAHRERVIGVVLSGDLDDGTVGLQAIKACGGIVIIQDPDDAVAPSMPSSALRYVEWDACLKSEEIAQRLLTLVDQIQPAAGAPTPAMVLENKSSMGDLTPIDELDQVARRSPFTCPECHGVLWEMDTAPLRYRCHTGHAYGALSIHASQDTNIEELLWAAVRAFHEKEALMLRQHESAGSSGPTGRAHEYKLMAMQARANADSLRQLLHSVSADAAVSRPDKK